MVYLYLLSIVALIICIYIAQTSKNKKNAWYAELGEAICFTSIGAILGFNGVIAPSIVVIVASMVLVYQCYRKYDSVFGQANEASKK